MGTTAWRHAVSLELFEDLKRYVDFGPSDAEALHAFLPHVRPCFPDIVAEFYRHVLEHEGTRRILKDPSQVERLTHTLKIWLEELFEGPHDAAYYEKRARIGMTHVRIALPQAYVFAAMSHIRRQLGMALRNATLPPSLPPDRVFAALSKILDLELALIAGSYHEAEKYRVLAEQASLAKLGQMAAIVAHEVKNPLAGIGGAIQVIGGHLPAGSPDRPIVKEILERLDALNRTVQDLLLYAKPRLPRPTPVRLKALMADITSLLSQDPALSGTRVTVSGSDLIVPADAELLKPVFLNLLINAAQAMGGTGKVEIAIRGDGKHAHVAFRDQGPGIPVAIREKIFEPFFTTKHRGTGLGLAIAKRVVELHGGTLKVDCPDGGGTVVTASLPCP